MAHDPTDLVLGRGEVYFDLFAEGTRVGTGERYLGNTPTFQITRVTERIERFRSYGGRKVEVKGVVTAEAHALNFITDHVSMENFALWFGNSHNVVAHAPTPSTTEPFSVEPNRFVQLGRTTSPFGVRNVSAVTVRIGNVVVPASGNYELDPATGRLKILGGAAFTGPTNITVQFSCSASVTKRTHSNAVERYGSMTFISKNVVGSRKNLFIPYVRLSSRGAIDLKGDEWQQMPFDATILKLNALTEQVYIDELVA